MDCFNDEPRKVPRPVPFSQTSTDPTVPEVSLILSEKKDPRAESNTFLGTEFQTYNAWKWKYINEKEQEKPNLSVRSHLQARSNGYYPINDKFSGSDIEKRKNEILYGSSDEPRKPLPPRTVHPIPECKGALFSDMSFDNEHHTTGYCKSYEKMSKINQALETSNKNMNYFKDLKKSEKNNAFDNLSDIRDLYQIIGEQNKQMVFLQKQIEQLLKSQETKEKHIEQLLKSQEAKENKIEQLLKMQDLKEKHIEQLLKAQEKHEKQIEHLIQSQEIREEKNNELVKQLKGLNKEVATVGVMATINVAEKSVNTSICCSCKNETTKRESGLIVSPEQNSGQCNQLEPVDKSYTLHSLNLHVIHENAPTPQSSIHVDIPEYNSSSDEESGSPTSVSRVHVHYLSDSKPLGYTFYNTVLNQVNDIIQSQQDEEIITHLKRKNETPADLSKQNSKKNTHFQERSSKKIKSPTYRDNYENAWIIHEKASADQQQNTDMMDGNQKYESDSEIQSGVNQKHKYHQSPSDISLKMNALALKYLKEEQISQYQLKQLPPQSSRQADVTIYNVTNLSFGTMRYLERYQTSSSENSKRNYLEGVHLNQFQHKKKT